MHSKPVVYNYLLKGAAAMANLFTKEEQEILRANPYTLSVNDRQIKFTVEFKRYLLNEIAKPGVTHKMAFRKLGYDPEMLGAHRVDTIVQESRLLHQKGCTIQIDRARSWLNRISARSEPKQR